MAHGPDSNKKVTEVTIRDVLCAVDLSTAAARALRYAAGLRSVLDAQVTVLFVRSHATDSPHDVESSELTAFIVATVGSASDIHLVQRQGEPSDEILRTCGTLECDLIVMGTHGRTGVQRLLLGSVAENVVRRSPTPVLVVPRAMVERDGPAQIESVICAVDFGASPHRVIEYAASIATAADARLILAHSLEWSEEQETLPSANADGFPTSEDDALARLRQLITSEMQVRCRPDLAVGYGSPADELLRLARERSADLIVLGVRRRNVLDLALFGSTARRVIRDAACPVLTVSTSG